MGKDQREGIKYKTEEREDRREVRQRESGLAREGE